MDIKIYKETDEYIIVEKPAGLLVHKSDNPHDPKENLADIIAKKYPEILGVGEPKRPGIVHRLDKNVSGIMVIARTQKMLEHLKKQFQKHAVAKEYLALAHGKVQADEGEINFKIARSKKTGKMSALPLNSDNTSAKQAMTEFLVLKRYANTTFISIIIKTGRTHQIRVHLNAYGHPIVGENLYRPKSLKSNIKLDRIFLHSHKIGFTDISGSYVEFESPLAESLQNLLESV